VNHLTNIKKDKERGTYYFVLSAGFNENGKRRQIKRTGFKTKKEADQKLIEIKAELNNNSYVDKSGIIFLDYLSNWMERKKKKITLSTYKRYERMCRLQIIPKLGHRKLQDITYTTIQDFIDYLSNQLDFKKKSCLLAITILKGVFQLAVKEGLIKSNPVQDIEYPVDNVKEMSVWDTDHIQRFLSMRNKKNKSKYYPAILMAILTGCRKGEILGLTWDSIDFDNGIIYITQILDSEGVELVRRTKNKKLRQVTIPLILIEELKKIREFQLSKAIYNPYNLVFCTSRGKRVIPNTLNDVLDKLTSGYELPRIRFHDLRHTHATLLLKENVNIKLIQERLGHSRVSTTLDVYSHVLPTMQHIVVEKLDKLLSV
jgi:integrase